MRNLLLIVIVCLWLPTLTASAEPSEIISPQLEAVLASAATDEDIAVIVILADKVDPSKFKDKNKAVRRNKVVKALKDKAAQSQGALTDFLKKKQGKRLKSFWIFNGLAVKVKPDVVYELATQPGVESIRLDDTLDVPVVIPSGAAPSEWNLDAVRAPELWNLGYIGTNIVIANMDTGVDVLHPDLANNWRGGSNSWFDPNSEHITPYDADGHGTRTMGIMVGGDNGGTAIGVAPGAQWIAVKIYNDAGNAAFSAIHQGFQWLLDPDNNAATDDAPDVVNNSWGLSTNVDQCIIEFQSDIQVLKSVGIAVVFSAGNEGPNSATSVSPANYPESLAVGAVDASRYIASLSSRGPSACDGHIYPDLVAPGIAVRTADLTFGGLFLNSYTYSSGTSFSAPHIAAGLALLISAYPNVALPVLEQALKDSAVDLGPVGPDHDYGYGLLDIVGAYERLKIPAGCTDSDGDGFYAEPDCGTAVDCNDLDAAINPAACDIKRDGIDQNCDGVDRLRGKGCPVVVDDGGGDDASTTTKEGKGDTCSDGLDNDGDGLIDCADPECAKNKSCK